MVLLGAMCDGRRVPAVTIFGWDDVLCPTTHAKVERNKRTAQSFGVPMAQSKDNRKEVRGVMNGGVKGQRTLLSKSCFESSYLIRSNDNSSNSSSRSKSNSTTWSQCCVAARESDSTRK